jgi:hypothetical protein
MEVKKTFHFQPLFDPGDARLPTRPASRVSWFHLGRLRLAEVEHDHGNSGYDGNFVRPGRTLFPLKSLFP